MANNSELSGLYSFLTPLTGAPDSGSLNSSPDREISFYAGIKTGTEIAKLPYLIAINASTLASVRQDSRLTQVFSNALNTRLEAELRSLFTPKQVPDHLLAYLITNIGNTFNVGTELIAQNPKIERPTSRILELKDVIDLGAGFGFVATHGLVWAQSNRRLESSHDLYNQGCLAVVRAVSSLAVRTLGSSDHKVADRWTGLQIESLNILSMYNRFVQRLNS